MKRYIFFVFCAAVLSLGFASKTALASSPSANVGFGIDALSLPTPKSSSHTWKLPSLYLPMLGTDRLLHKHLRLSQLGFQSFGTMTQYYAMEAVFFLLGTAYVILAIGAGVALIGNIVALARKRGQIGWGIAGISTGVAVTAIGVLYLAIGLWWLALPVLIGGPVVIVLGTLNLVFGIRNKVSEHRQIRREHFRPDLSNEPQNGDTPHGDYLLTHDARRLMPHTLPIISFSF